MSDELTVIARVYTMEALVPGGCVRHHAYLLREAPAGTDLCSLSEANARYDSLYDSHVRANAESLAKSVRIASLEAALTEAKGRIAELEIAGKEALEWMVGSDYLIDNDRGVGPYTEDESIAAFRKALGTAAEGGKE